MPPELKQYILSNYGTSYGSPLNLVTTHSRSILAGPKTTAKSKVSEKPKRANGEGSIQTEEIVLAHGKLGNVTPVMTIAADNK